MILGLNWVDLIILAVLIFFAVEALTSNLLAEVIDFLSFLLAFFISFRYYNLPAQLLEDNFKIPHGLSLVLGFMTAWFLTEVIFYILVRLLLPKIPKFKIWGEDFIKVLPALLKGIIFISLFLVLTATFPIQPTIKIAVQDSQIGSRILKEALRIEQPVKNVFGGVSQDSLAFLTIKPKTNESVDLGFKTTKFKVDEKEEQAMIEKVNQERVKQGLKELTFNAKLRDVARFHSEDMFTRGYFSHYSQEGQSVAERAEQFKVDYLVIGENLAYAPNLELAHQGLMNSEGHRANILSPDYGKIGIGVMDGGVYGKMFTQVFSN